MTISAHVPPARHLAAPTFARIGSTMTNTEHVYTNEDVARAARRRFINADLTVSLIAGDYRNGRDVFVFDVSTPAPAPTRVLPSGDTVRAYTEGDWS